jgi:monoterpene epsilon-lactone hydrolase
LTPISNQVENRPKPSPQSSVLRYLLRLRKAAFQRNVPVETLRFLARRGEWWFRLPRGIEIHPAIADGVPAEWIVPLGAESRSTIFYIHGGGWTIGLYNVHRRLVAHICRAAGTRALVLDYRLAPENSFPAALEDCVAGYRSLLRNGTLPQEIVIAGDSAGANLLLAAVMMLRDQGYQLPAAAVCISPITDLEGTGESFHRNDDPSVTVEFVLSTISGYAHGQDLRFPLLSPCRGDLRGLPPMLIQVGEDEMLLSDAMRLRDSACKAGVEASLTIWPRMWHVWHVFAPLLPEAKQAIDAIGVFIRERLKTAKARE